MICAKFGDKFALLLARAKVSARVSAMPRLSRGIPDSEAMGGIWELRVHTLDGSPECAKVSIPVEPRAKTLPAFLLGILDYPLSTSLRPLVVFEGFLGSVPPEDVPLPVSFLNCQSAIFVPKWSKRSFQIYFWGRRT